MDYPFIEESVYQIGRLLGGGFVNSTRLLFIQIPAEDTYAVQASRAVGDVGLDEILRIPAAMMGLKKMLGEDRFLQDLPSLLDGRYYQDWYENRGVELKAKYEKEHAEKLGTPKPETLKPATPLSQLPFEVQARIFLQALYALPKEHWPRELIETRVNKKLYEKLKGILQAENPELRGEALQLAIEIELRKLDQKDLLENRGLRNKPLFALLALVERYPELIAGQYLTDLIQVPEVLKLVHDLFVKESKSKLSPDTILKSCQTLLQNFDRRNLSQQVLLAVLSEPSDHKGDNFRVMLNYDAEGQLLPFEVIAIDNDAAMEGVYQCIGEHQHISKVRSIFLSLIEHCPCVLDKTLHELLLSREPQVLVLQLLQNLIEYQRHYQVLLAKSPQRLRELHLDKPIPQEFILRLTLSLEKIQAAIKESLGPITLQNLFDKVHARLSLHYLHVASQFQDPQAIIMALYDRQNPQLVEDASLAEDRKLSGDAKPLGETKETAETKKVAEAIVVSPSCYQSLVMELERFVQSKALLDAGNPVIQLQTLQVLLLLKQKGMEAQMTGIGDILQKLEISDTALIEVYKRHQKIGMEFLKQFKSIILRLGTKNPISCPLTEPQLLFQVMSDTPDSAILVEALIALGVNPKVVRSQDGYTPLHLAARFNLQRLIPILVSDSVSLEAFDNQGRTPLDLSIQYQHEESMTQLLSLGAGACLQLKNGLNLMSRYSERAPLLCRQLLSLNLELAWHLGLNEISQDKAPNDIEEVGIEVDSGRRYLKSSIYRQIFKANETFPKQNLYGRHRVTAIRCQIATDIEVGLHLKENPELPGREIMVHTLGKVLFGLITPSVTVLKFSKEQSFLWRKNQIEYPVLVSRTIQGRTLLDVMNESPEIVSKIDPKSFSEAIILAMLINPEDGRPDNYMVEPYVQGAKTCYRLISIDNDHAFVRPLALKQNGEEVEGSAGLQVKTILYCLDSMREALHPEIVERLLEVEPQALLQQWLEVLHQQQVQVRKLFSDKERKTLAEQNIHLDVLFKPSIVGDIYQKLARIQATLRKIPGISILKLLRRVIPELGLRYTEAFEKFSTPALRFQFLTKGCFEARMMKPEELKGLQEKQTLKIQSLQYEISKTTTARIMEMTKANALETLAFDKEKDESLETGLKRLKEIEENYNKLRKILDEVQASVSSTFESFVVRPCTTSAVESRDKFNSRRPPTSAVHTRRDSYERLLVWLYAVSYIFCTHCRSAKNSTATGVYSPRSLRRFLGSQRW